MPTTDSACPGAHVANRSLFISTAMLLWAFDIRECSKHPIDTMAFTNTLNARAEPFEVEFREREGVKARELLNGNTKTESSSWN